MENPHDSWVADAAETNTLPRPAQRLLAAALYAALALVWLLDLESSKGLRTTHSDWLPPLVAGPAAAGLLFLPDRWLSLERRAWAAACGSLALTGGMLLAHRPSGGSWGVLESVCLLIMLARTCRLSRRPLAAVALAAAVIAAPVRLDNPDSLANAARTIRATEPEQIDLILENIQKAGAETLVSMRRLVRVLREVDGRPRRSGELFAELAALVSDFRTGEARQATLSVADPARTARLAPEVETSVHRLVQESLTNVRRHAADALVAVQVGLEDGRLRVEVRNTPPAARSAAPVGGRGGFGVVGLRERMAATDGTLQAGGTPDGGWLVVATFPVLAAAGSAR